MTLSKFLRAYAPKVVTFLILAEIYSMIAQKLNERNEAAKKNAEENDEIFISGQGEIDMKSVTLKKISFKREPALVYAEILENLILSARKSVHVAMYIFTSNILAEALRKAHERGVHVLVIIDSSMENSSNSRIRYLIDSGIEVKIHSNKTLHLKMCLIDVDYDDKSFVPKQETAKIKQTIKIPYHGCVISGSMNWTREALTNNYDTFTIYRNPNVIKSSAKAFYNIWKKNIQ